MKKFILFAVCLLPASLLGQNVSGNDTGPHGGTIVQNSTHRFEVKIDQDGQNIEVFTLNAKKRPPQNMSITLFRDSGTGQTISLRALKPKDPLPKFQGELSPNAGSYIGAELKFDVSLKSFKTLKFIPYIPKPSGSGH